MWFRYWVRIGRVYVRSTGLNETILQRYILYNGTKGLPQRAPRDPLWPLLNTWNIYAALNFSFSYIFPLDIWSVEWILFARAIQVSIVNTF